MVSEAGHYRLFIDLATKYYTEQHVRDTWQQWLNAETEVLQLLTPRGDRMH
jgi:tRNA-(ms[2]io[6]A)-hydroxylase